MIAEKKKQRDENQEKLALIQKENLETAQSFNETQKEYDMLMQDKENLNQ